MARPGSRRRRVQDEAVLAVAIQTRLAREQKALLLEFASHLNRVAWEDKTDETLVDEFLEAR